uniref:BRCT domain-containing protein n=1 Tax=Macrostomum lignano TaxID=282301 RepID=A0A1I8IB97_9PLAT
EPFRWDQRLYGLVLRFPALTDPQSGAAGQQQYVRAAGDSPIDIMCEVTGGRSYKLVNQRMLNQCLESLCQKCQPGIVVHLEKLGPDPPPATDDKGRPSIAGTAWHSCKRMLYVKVSTQRGNATGHWPIPEAYWPDLSAYRLPPRSAHPLVRFVCQKAEPQAIDGFPFDKYELEPSPLTQYILERREPHSPGNVTAKSSAPEAQKPFGYLKPASNLQSVNLIVLPYDYPTLFALLDELIKLHKMKPTDQWRARFAEYLRRMPSYYGQPLARAMEKLGVKGVVPDQVSHAVPVSPAVQSYLKKVRVAAKAEYDRVVVATAASNQQHPEEGRFIEVARPCVMRANLLAALRGASPVHDDSRHSQPVSVMGNYTEYLKRQPPPLRELDSSPLRLHTFGNPFKLAKQMKQVGFQAVDEADELQQLASNRKRPHSGGVGGAGGVGGGGGSVGPAGIDLSSPSLPKRRKPGPLPPEVTLRSLRTPPPSPAPHRRDSIDSLTSASTISGFGDVANLSTSDASMPSSPKSPTSPNSPMSPPRLLPADGGDDFGGDIDNTCADSSSTSADHRQPSSPSSPPTLSPAAAAAAAVLDERRHFEAADRLLTRLLPAVRGCPLAGLSDLLDQIVACRCRSDQRRAVVACLEAEAARFRRRILSNCSGGWPAGWTRLGTTLKP